MLWALVAIFCLSAEIIALTLVSLTAPYPDNQTLIEQRDALRHETGADIPENTRENSSSQQNGSGEIPGEITEGRSLKALITLLTPLLDRDTRITQCSITKTGAIIQLEARSAESLHETITGILAEPQLCGTALTQRSMRGTQYCATLTSGRWG